MTSRGLIEGVAGGFKGGGGVSGGLATGEGANAEGSILVEVREVGGGGVGGFFYTEGAEPQKSSVCERLLRRTVFFL
jgi:hypothetical protein